LSNTFTEASLFKPSSKKERYDDKPNHVIRESGKCGREGECFGGDGGSDGNESPGTDCQGLKDEAGNGGDENRK